MSSAPFYAWQWTGEAFAPCAALPLADRGFRYGMALFESFRVRGGRGLFLEEHWDRLREACRQRGFPLAEGALDSVAALLANQPGDLFGRLYVTAGEGGPADPCTQPGCYLLLEPRALSSAASYRAGLSSGVHHPIFGGIKTANYWPNADALQQARTRGYDEALLFNENAELVSASMANVFVVKDGQIKTPALACGARAGVVREWVRWAALVRECSLFVQDLRTADEIFLTNSWLGIMPLSHLDQAALPSQSVAAELRERYARTVESL